VSVNTTLARHNPVVGITSNTNVFVPPYIYPGNPPGHGSDLQVDQFSQLPQAQFVPPAGLVPIVVPFRAIKKFPAEPQETKETVAQISVTIFPAGTQSVNVLAPQAPQGEQFGGLHA